MATPKTQAPTTGQKPNPADQINFTLKVAATNLPMDHKDFKIKIAMDFGSGFTPDLTTRTSGPNFNATRVRSILNFISGKVIQKVIEYIYCKNYYVKDGKPYKLINDDKINSIYANRAKYRQKKALDTKPGLKEEEEFIARFVNAIIDNERREIPVQEKNVESIQFEELSAGVLTVSARDIVNGDMPPPK
jgi:hypothetical protein